ncbi:MAG: hypothetical protein NVSMB25_16860 [Thermoleophilaceae bacterium]
MALRLSTVQGISESAPQARFDFGMRAQACLAAGDLTGFERLFEEAAALNDIHRRHKARLTLVEQGFAAAETTQRSQLPALYLAIVRATLTLLDGEPREPTMLNYLGVATYELGALDAAEALFRAALRLDPTLPHADRNLAEVRRSKRRPQPTLPPAVGVALSGLAVGAKACAERARPAKGLTLSLCMIVKDEEEMLPRCLAAAAPAVDEIVIVDTGSSDRTVEIAESFGARVIHHEWTGSFAEARNVSLEAATGDWLMYLDADEVLVADDAPRIRELTGKVWREAFFLVETNFTGELEDGTAVTHQALRVWRNRPRYRFEGRLHEQFAHALPGYLPERLESTTVRVEHYGYLGVVRDAKEKTRRNIELLERQAAEGVDTPFQAFNLGSEYGAVGDERRALEQFQKAWRMLEDDHQRTLYPYVPSLSSRYVKALRVCGELDAARAQADEGLRLFPGFTDLVFEQACCARDSGDRLAAAELFERCLEMGDAPARYSATVGCGSYLALVALAELRASIGQADAAEGLLLRCLDENRSFLGAVYPLAGLMLRRGHEPEAVVEAIDARIETMTPSVNFMLGTALYEAGAAGYAEARFRSVLERQPGSGPARVALAESLLSQSRLDEAATEAAQLAPGDACAPAARRTELFARLAGGELDLSARALARSGAELDPAELALFEAWHDAAGGGRLPASLPHSSAAVLLTVLEALLRLREVDAFGLIFPLVERVGLAVRQRRELLATMYLRRGYLDSAADEWIAACEELGADAAAMIGLAQVAAAKELPDDALNFAREARAIEPGNAVAERLVDRLEAIGRSGADAPPSEVAPIV